jgi:hypothetical protein
MYQRLWNIQVSDKGISMSKISISIVSACSGDIPRLAGNSEGLLNRHGKEG